MVKFHNIMRKSTLYKSKKLQVTELFKSLMILKIRLARFLWVLYRGGKSLLPLLDGIKNDASISTRIYSTEVQFPIHCLAVLVVGHVIANHQQMQFVDCLEAV